MSELERIREQNHLYDYACITVFHKYEQLVCAIERDEKLSYMFRLWSLKEDLQEAYRSVLDALFGDRAKFSKEVAKIRADEKIIKACQIFNWSAAATLDGYRERVDYAIKHKIMPKKTAERMYENFKKRFEEEELPDKLAQTFSYALIRIGEDDLRRIYEELGEDFEAAMKNYERYLQKNKEKEEAA